jgi:16S rRNA (guanine966-N2)-methyltransferase
MRVIAGKFKGRILRVPKQALTRPTTDRAREGIFNSLNSDGGIEGATVLDLFAGSGSLGIEALSRGAASVTFVDHDKDALETIRKNLEQIHATNFNLHKSEIKSFVLGMNHFDVIFLDPPFALSDEEWSDILASLKTDLIVAESNRDISELLPPSHPVQKLRRYGDSVVIFARRNQASE